MPPRFTGRRMRLWRNRLFRVCLQHAVLLCAAAVAVPARAAEPAALVVRPPELTLDAPEAADQFVVFARMPDGSLADVTREAAYLVEPAGVAAVLPLGQAVPRQEGSARVSVSWRGLSGSAVVHVRGYNRPEPISFSRDVLPVLSKAGCNSGSCHGKAEGQNGFKLSVFGHDPAADYQAIARDARGRRANLVAPDASLLLLKATAQMPHGGGQKIDRGSSWHARLRRWIAEGASEVSGNPDPVAALAAEPAEIVLRPGSAQQLRVVATHASGRVHGVTAEAEFLSNNEEVAAVDRQGLVRTTSVPGTAAVLVRYAGQVALCRISLPREGPPMDRPPERNFIDRIVWDHLQRLRIPASDLADDATYLRRVYLDTIGTLPTAAEARAFLQDRASDKRSRLAAALLRRPEYADYWALRWADLLQLDKDLATPLGALAMTRWLRGQFARNQPYDQFVRAILTARGATQSESAAAFFQVHADPEKLARSVSQVFLGVRIECAQCHHHPFERWDQADYYALAGFFTGIDRKPLPNGGLKIVGRAGTDLNHPRTGAPAPAAALAQPAARFAPGADRRAVLADWVTSPDNPYFARTLVNRLWAHYFGRGLFEPVDDQRATNPAVNEELLAALASHLVELRFDLRAFTLTLLDSRAYQLASRTAADNQLDQQNGSHALWKSIPAEVLLDAVSQATGVPEEFNGLPRGTRAIQVWDNRLPSVFLEIFGRPARRTVCSCERGDEPSMAQALHLMNAESTMRKLQHPRGRAARLAESALDDDALIEELYLGTLSRFPAAEERDLMKQALAGSADRREIVEDLLWTLINQREFVFNH